MNVNKTIEWKIFKNLKHPPKLQGSIWKIYAENDINIKVKENHRIALGLGYEMSKGIVCVSLDSNLKHGLTLFNGLFLDYKTDNLVVCLYNFSNEQTTIKKGKMFAYVKYLK